MSVSSEGYSRKHIICTKLDIYAVILANLSLFVIFVYVYITTEDPIEGCNSMNRLNPATCVLMSQGPEVQFPSVCILVFYVE